jgi:hypothetical protein
MAMSALNAAPNQNPFAFECKAHYRTDSMEFDDAIKNVAM